MRRTRWKLAAGAVALSVGGLAAVADVPSRAGIVSCAGTPVAPQEPSSPPPVIPLLPVPATPSGNVATPAELPVIPASPQPLLPVAGSEKAPEPRTSLIPPTLPTPLPTLEPPTIQPEPVRTLPPTEIQASPLPSVPPQPAPEPLIQRSPANSEKKLQVILHLGDDRPRFEVRDGDEIYLKVVCDRVDVKSPSDRGETMSILRASGRVSFVAPGGEGMCEDLSLTPGTGQVIVTGQVAFRSTWGRVETTVSGEKMTFRLGTAPGAGPASPATVPASFQHRQ